MKKCVRKRCRELNKNSFPGKYRSSSCRIPVQPDLVDITKLPGVTSTNFIRSTFRNGEQTSLTNFISPWNNQEVAQKFTGNALNQLNIDQQPRTYAKSRKLSTNARKPENKELNHIKTRYRSKRKRDEWNDTFRILLNTTKF